MLRRLKPQEEENLIVGTASGDDAAVWKLDDERALVVTADFITPVVDDPRTWGKVAAANAVSDIYAMGAKPLLALNLLGWNSEKLSLDLLSEVLEGANEIAAKGGFVIAGGHTVEDPEPKFGLAVVGEVNPQRLLRNSEFRENDVLILTKKLGIGVATTAIKSGQASDEVIEAAVESMLKLNGEASLIAVEAGATGATDITGFGLLGHLGRAAAESNVNAKIEVSKVPLLPNVRELAKQGNLPGGSKRNLQWVSERLDTGSTEEIDVLILADAQTSGGLLFGVQPEFADEALASLDKTGHDSALIGQLTPGTGKMRLV